MTSARELHAVAARLGCRLIGHTPLTGGVSAEVLALDVERADGTVGRVVFRRHGAAGWKALEQGVASIEHGVLEALSRLGFEVPAPLLVDESGEIVDGPYLVVEHVDGDGEPRDLAAGIEAMAAFLVRLHELDPDAIGLPSSMPHRDDLVAVILEYLPPRLDAIRDAVEAAGSAADAARAVLHGDFWPGNVLWHGDEIAAVLDWEDTAIGDPACDLAGARVELLWRHGQGAADAFTAAYVAGRGVAPDPVRLALWELYVTSAGLAFMDRWGLDPEVEATMRSRSVPFLDRAAEAVAAG